MNPPAPTAGRVPPPLPPRNPLPQHQAQRQDSIPSTISSPPPSSPGPSTSRPPPHHLLQLTTDDPRSKSTDSLRPSPSASPSRSTSTSRDIYGGHDGHHGGRRKLLLIYIHGFMGNETSFRSFPAHVHHVLTLTLRETHVVHTKIYPRYVSKRPLETVAEELSRWLVPHEAPTTDVVLLGHSMGGLLSAEVVLLRPVGRTSYSTAQPPQREYLPGLRHRILGTINLDVPFLGMHPGVIVSGISSIFRPADDPPEVIQSPEAGTEADIDDDMSIASDPNYNPRYANDHYHPERSGWKMWHFLSKHYKAGESLRQATTQLVKSHVEFGGAMADYKGLKARYRKIRALEEEDARFRAMAIPELAQGSQRQSSEVPRRRFINFYTTATGRVKPEKQQAVLKEAGLEDEDIAKQIERTIAADVQRRMAVSSNDPGAPTRSATESTQLTSPSFSIEEFQDGKLIKKEQPAIDELVKEQSDSEESEEPSEMEDDDEDSWGDDEVDPVDQYMMAFDDDGDGGAPSSGKIGTGSRSTAVPKKEKPKPKPKSKPKPAALPVLTEVPSNASVKQTEIPPSAQTTTPAEVAAQNTAVSPSVHPTAPSSASDMMSPKTETSATPTTAASRQPPTPSKFREELNMSSTDEFHTMDEHDDTSSSSSDSERRSTEKHRRKSGEESRSKEEDEEERRKKEEKKKEKERKAAEKKEAKERKAQLKKEQKELKEKEKQEAREAKAREKQEQKEQKEKEKKQKEQAEAEAAVAADQEETTHDHDDEKNAGKEKDKKPKSPRIRRFCIVPSHDSAWHPVRMPGVDEVGAHCSLFMPAANVNYESLVGEVVGIVEAWVAQDLTQRELGRLAAEDAAEDAAAQGLPPPYDDLD